MTANPASKGLPPEEIIRRVKITLRKFGDTHTWEDIVAGLKAGHYQIFWNAHGCAITEILAHPNKRILNCWITAGELPGVMDLHSEVVDFARKSGCEFMTTTARKGWLSILPKFGWKEKAVMLTYKVE